MQFKKCGMQWTCEPSMFYIARDMKSLTLLRKMEEDGVTSCGNYSTMDKT